LSPRLLVLIAAAALVAAACGPAAAPSPESAPSRSATVKKVKIVSSLPLQGPTRLWTIPIVNAIKMALDEHGGLADGTVVEYESYDDASAAKQNWDAEVEAANARKAAADPSVVAYVGPYNSGAARASIPITCQASLVMISPANTYQGLTKPFERDEPGRYYPNCKRNFSRVIAPDDVQGAVGARWAKELGAKKVYILYDADPSSLYGRVVAEAFRGEAKKIGLEELAYDAAPKANDFTVLAAKVAASGADFVYYGGHIGNNPGFLLRDLRLAKPSITFMAPDGIIDARFIAQAGEKALNTYVTESGLEVEHYTGKSKEWADRYAAKYGERPVGAFAIYGYEAANLILAAIAKAGPKADDRATVRDLVMATRDFEGVTGKWSFDENGDTSLQTMAGLKITRIGIDFESSMEFQKELH
jgi:branched-chain amino acid transport system substrate-binding protein